jgi:hypothetical protein
MHPLAAVAIINRMSVFGSSSPVSRLEVPSRLRRPQAGSRPAWGKRVFTALAQKLHESTLLFSAAVRMFRGMQRLGINLVPNHFYWPVPDLAELERSDWAVYPQPERCPFQLHRQAALAREFSDLYGDEWTFDSRPSPRSYHYGNGFFESCDAEVAYSMVRHWKPARIVEIGCGFSSRVMLAALRANREFDGVPGKLIALDPNPDRLPRGEFRSEDDYQAIQMPVQRLDPGVFSELRPDDIVFIDSSHVVSVGSDVTREYLQILPRVPPGVLVHIHDIFLPYDYPRDAVLNNLCFWSEQYLLQAFLTFNTEFEVLWSASAMQDEFGPVLDECFPDWTRSYSAIPRAKRRFVPSRDGERVWPSSFWMRRVPRR